MPPLIDPPPVASGVLGGPRDLTERLPRPVHPNRRWGLRLEAKSAREQLWWGRRWGIDTPRVFYRLGFGEWAPLVGYGVAIPPASEVRAFTPDGLVEGMPEAEEDVNQAEVQAMINAAMSQPAANVVLTGTPWQVLHLPANTRTAYVRAENGPVQIEAVLVAGAVDGQRLMLAYDVTLAELESSWAEPPEAAQVWLQAGGPFTELVKKSAEEQHKAQEAAKEPLRPYGHGFPKLGAQPGGLLEMSGPGYGQPILLNKQGVFDLLWIADANAWSGVV